MEWYNFAHSQLKNHKLLQTVSDIIREEEGFPNKVPHYDLLIKDLSKIGLTSAEVKRTILSTKSADSYVSLWSLTRAHKENDDVRIMAVLRTAGEILVGEEYSYIVAALQRKFGLNEKDSVFYFPHALHDNLRNGEHSRKFEEAIEPLIDTEEALNIALSGMDEAFRARMKFFDQFVK